MYNFHFCESGRGKVRSRSEREVSESAAHCGIRLSRAQISSNNGLAQVERSNARWARRKSESSENTHKAERLNTAQFYHSD